MPMSSAVTKMNGKHRKYSRNGLMLLNNMENFAYSLVIFNDMGDGVGLPAVDVLHSKTT